MAYTRVLSCVMLALISSIIASIQLNLAIINIQENYGDLTLWTLTLDKKALNQKLQAQIDSACAFGV